MEKSKRKRTKSSGFTLLEILLVVAAIAILAGIVIVAINPSKQLGQTRDAQRKSDVNTILNAVYQYAIDHSGKLPTGIGTAAVCDNTAAKEVCKTGKTGTCTDLAVLTDLQAYIVTMPNDPSVEEATVGTGYYITKSANGRVTVCAPGAEQTAKIEVTR